MKHSAYIVRVGTGWPLSPIAVHLDDGDLKLNSGDYPLGRAVTDQDGIANFGILVPEGTALGGLTLAARQLVAEDYDGNKLESHQTFFMRFKDYDAKATKCTGSLTRADSFRFEKNMLQVEGLDYFLKTAEPTEDPRATDGRAESKDDTTKPGA